MNNPTKIDASVGIKPQRSQIFVVTLLILSFIGFFYGFNLFTEDTVSGVILIILSFILILVSIACWVISFRSADLSKSLPTTISENENGLFQLTTDSRLLDSQKAAAQLIEIMQAVTFRRRLPEPVGLVDQAGNGMPDTKVKAVETVEKINEEMKSEENKIKEIHSQSYKLKQTEESSIPTEGSVLPKEH